MTDERTNKIWHNVEFTKKMMLVRLQMMVTLRCSMGLTMSEDIFGKYIFGVFENFSGKYVSVHVCLVPAEIKRGFLILWNRSC